MVAGSTTASGTPSRVRRWPTGPRRCVEVIRTAAGLPDLEVELIGVFPWSFGAAVAETVRVGEVFLVGDAAHRTTPRGATGMNTGIADGHNLGWKLAWVARGWAGPVPRQLRRRALPRGAAQRARVARGVRAGDDRRPRPGLRRGLRLLREWSAPPPAPAGVASCGAAGPGLPGAVREHRAPHAWVEHLGRTRLGPRPVRRTADAAPSRAPADRRREQLDGAGGSRASGTGPDEAATCSTRRATWPATTGWYATAPCPCGPTATSPGAGRSWRSPPGTSAPTSAPS